MSVQEKFIQFPSGGRMPLLGYGTWQAQEKELEDALEMALQAGYRHIDTAAAYENEHIIGKVLNRWLTSGRIKRDELFITTKLPPSGNRPSGVEKFINASLRKLQLDYLDLYLVHTPFSFKEGDELHPFDTEGNIIIDPSTDHLAVWKEMEKQVRAGRTKAIGLSNFNINQIQRILDNCVIKPENLQIELHVYFQQKEVTEFCKKNNITVTAYSPLGTRGSTKLFQALGFTKELPDLLSNPTVVEIANTKGRSPGQILLRHIIQKGYSAIPKSTSEKHIVDNLKVLEFSLSDPEVERLNGLDQGESARILDFKFFKGVEKHPEMPF